MKLFFNFVLILFLYMSHKDAQHDSVSESIARIDNNSTPGLSNSNVEQQSIDDSATDNTSNSQP